MKDNLNYGVILKQLRKHYGLTLAELSEILSTCNYINITNHDLQFMIIVRYYIHEANSAAKASRHTGSP